MRNTHTVLEDNVPAWGWRVHGAVCTGVTKMAACELVMMHCGYGSASPVEPAATSVTLPRSAADWASAKVRPT